MAEFARDEVLKRLNKGESLERANLREIQLEGASLVKANLARVDLTGANLAGADLREAVLTNASVREAFLQGANLEGATLRNADLDGANLSAAVLQDSDLSRANLEGANLEGAKLNRARLANAIFSDANLGKVEMAEAKLRSAEFTDAYLGGANLRAADFRKATFVGANLEEADLSGADLRECDLSSALVDGTIFEGAKVYGIEIERERLDQARITWWDVSRAGDGSAREEGSWIGQFLGGGSDGAGAADPASPAGPATRFFGQGDVLKNADLEFSAGSIVEVDGRFENCKIALGEEAQLKVGKTGFLRDCQITGRGVILVHGRMLNDDGKALTIPKVFFVGSTGTAVGTIKQPQGLTRFGFEPGCVLRLKITT